MNRADRIATEHEYRYHALRCACGWRPTSQVLALGDHAAHVAWVTAEAIATDIEALEFSREAVRDLVRFGGSVEWSEGHDDAVREAVRVARGGGSA